MFIAREIGSRHAKKDMRNAWDNCMPCIIYLEQRSLSIHHCHIAVLLVHHSVRSSETHKRGKTAT